MHANARLLARRSPSPAPGFGASLSFYISSHNSARVFIMQDTDNPAVQLQGPFVIQKLVPPPAHRNVVMIAAGTI